MEKHCQLKSKAPLCFSLLQLEKRTDKPELLEQSTCALIRGTWQAVARNGAVRLTKPTCRFQSRFHTQYVQCRNTEMQSGCIECLLFTDNHNKVQWIQD